MATPPYSFTAMALILRAVLLSPLPFSTLLTHTGDTLNRLASISPVPFLVQIFFGEFPIFPVLIFFVILNARLIIKLDCKNTKDFVIYNKKCKKIRQLRKEYYNLLIL